MASALHGYPYQYGSCNSLVLSGTYDTIGSCANVCASTGFLWCVYSLDSGKCWGYSELDGGDCNTLDAQDSTEFKVFKLCVSTLQVGALGKSANLQVTSATRVTA